MVNGKSNTTANNTDRSLRTVKRSLRRLKLLNALAALVMSHVS